MDTYFAIIIPLVCNFTLLAGSAIALIWVYSRYGKSPQLLITGIVSVPGRSSSAA